MNTLAVDATVDEGRYTSFAVTQSAHPDHPTLRRHRIGVGLYDRAEDGRLVRRTTVETDVVGERTDVAKLLGAEQPDLVLLNDGDLSYAKVRFDERSLATVRESIQDIDDSLARAVCWGALWDMTRDAELPAGAFVEMVPAKALTNVSWWSLPAAASSRRRRRPDSQVTRSAFRLSGWQSWSIAICT